MKFYTFCFSLSTLCTTWYREEHVSKRFLGWYGSNWYDQVRTRVFFFPLELFEVTSLMGLLSFGQHFTFVCQSKVPFQSLLRNTASKSSGGAAVFPAWRYVLHLQVRSTQDRVIHPIIHPSIIFGWGGGSGDKSSCQWGETPDTTLKRLIALFFSTCYTAPPSG